MHETDSLGPANLFTACVALLGLVSLVAAYYISPAPPSISWWIVSAALIGLALTAEFLALTISERGSATTMDYVPELGAILLVGPFGAGLVAGTSWALYYLFVADKPWPKTIFNVGQLTLAASLAGLIYIMLGGHPNLHAFNIGDAIVPFAGAVVSYFAINRTAVSTIISISNNRPFRKAWQDIALTPIAFDLAASSLALLVAFFYVRWGVLALVAIIIPLIGLRYSYGVNLELKQLNSDLLRVLIKTIEAQDPYTSGHSVRVAEGAIALAREIGLNPHETNKIETAALLHDIGKIDAAYREILTQEGPLADEQRKLIKEHPERGVQLIRSVRSLDPDVLEYIKYHHERYDGTGYPDGLKGEEIPLGARIIMVTDSIDAMVTSRAYRDALSPDKARSELRENKGTQFDPELVDAALELNLIKQHMDAAANESSTRSGAYPYRSTALG